MANTRPNWKMVGCKWYAFYAIEKWNYLFVNERRPNTWTHHFRRYTNIRALFTGWRMEFLKFVANIAVAIVRCIQRYLSLLFSFQFPFFICTVIRTITKHRKKKNSAFDTLGVVFISLKQRTKEFVSGSLGRRFPFWKRILVVFGVDSLTLNRFGCLSVGRWAFLVCTSAHMRLHEE